MDAPSISPTSQTREKTFTKLTLTTRHGDGEALDNDLFYLYYEALPAKEEHPPWHELARFADARALYTICATKHPHLLAKRLAFEFQPIVLNDHRTKDKQIDGWISVLSMARDLGLSNVIEDVVFIYRPEEEDFGPGELLSSPFRDKLTKYDLVLSTDMPKENLELSKALCEFLQDKHPTRRYPLNDDSAGEPKVHFYTINKGRLRELLEGEERWFVRWPKELSSE